MIESEALARRMAGLESIGLSESGTNRLAWTAEAQEAAGWFEDQARDAGLECERDPAGNLWAYPAAQPPWWALGSHVDSVRDGGRFDGALGVAAAFEVAARSQRPLAVIAFADEEGARFNTPTFGSRALAGRLDVERTLARRDDDGVTLAEAMAGAGADPGALAEAREGIARLRGFLELHIDQTRELAEAGSAAGVVRAVAARIRVAADLRGAADHAGTTRGSERRDAVYAAARTIVAAHESGKREPELLVACGRIAVDPNALTTLARHVTVWLDARAPDAATVAAWRSALAEAAGRIGAATGVGIELETQSESPPVRFDDRVREVLVRAAAHDGAPVPELVSFAGHDAGVLADVLPTGMVFVRNRSGVSHAPHEAVDLGDAAVGAGVMLRAVEQLA